MFDVEPTQWSGTTRNQKSKHLLRCHGGTFRTYQAFIQLLVFRGPPVYRGLLSFGRCGHGKDNRVKGIYEESNVESVKRKLDFLHLNYTVVTLILLFLRSTVPSGYKFIIEFVPLRCRWCTLS